MLVAVLVAGCETNDIGKECAGMSIPTQSGATSEGDVFRAQGSEAVEYDTAFPCADIVCVATLGTKPYCSRECATDRNCPLAFECKTVMTYGPFAERQYCVWRTCERDQDCGDPWTIACKEVPELSLNVPFKVCGWR
ncbi:MAG: hypothetical protein HY903_08015 [Deltaproteobacteria bacterium]|nr:hypothetical protein [Deltaproteobacteria bacterium]